MWMSQKSSQAQAARQDVDELQDKMWIMQSDVVLCCIVLCCGVLCCHVLCCVMLWCVMLCLVVPYCAVLCFAVLIDGPSTLQSFASQNIAAQQTLHIKMSEFVGRLLVRDEWIKGLSVNSICEFRKNKF